MIEVKLSLNDEVLKFVPDEAPAEPSGNLKAMRVSDLLRMWTGQQGEPPRKPDEPWAKTFLWRSRHGAYRGDGAFGQYCIVLLEQDAVIAITSGVRDMQSMLNLVWDNLLPGLTMMKCDRDALGCLHL